MVYSPLSVGVALLWLSGFFVLVGQPSSARADAVNPTLLTVPNDASGEKGDLPEALTKWPMLFPSEQSIPTPGKCDTQALQKK